MPGWRVKDEATAATLATHIGENEISVVTEPGTKLNGGAVILAPTRHDGTVLLITARPRPLVHESRSFADPVVTPTQATPVATEIETEETESYPEETYFGPTSWDRAEQIESLPVFENSLAPVESVPPLEAESVLQVPTEPPITHEPAPTLDPMPVLPPKSRDRHYVATGFLGLEDSTEDDEDLARDKRPWWKKIFSD